MAVTVVGSVAFDAVETPFGRRERILGGAATHFALAASFFTDVRVVGVVGDDFGAEEFAVFQSRGINVEDIEQIAGDRSFFWAGRYDNDMQVAQTIDTQLNVFAGFDPVLSSGARASRVTFLANIQPDLQRRVREQCSGAVVTGLDSMNYWIESARESLLETIGCVDVVSLNDTEVRMLTGQPNLARAAREICALGPRVLVVKQGSYGACMFTDGGFFFVPGYPLETVVDPTGAGDSFAGGFFGYLDSHLESGEVTDEVLRRAAVYGSVIASFAIGSFGSERLQTLTLPEIESRFAEFKQMTHFEAKSSLVRAAER
ncbi:MAG: sugar kinase [Actinobacteria bacterium]|nr:sugar kinase [Actinomycetota bacterium]